MSLAGWSDGGGFCAIYLVTFNILLKNKPNHLKISEKENGSPLIYWLLSQ